MDDFTVFAGASLPSPMERLERIPRYLGCLADLVGSTADLHTVSSDNLALLIDLITENMDTALIALRQQLKS